MRLEVVWGRIILLFSPPIPLASQEHETHMAKGSASPDSKLNKVDLKTWKLASLRPIFSPLHHYLGSFIPIPICDWWSRLSPRPRSTRPLIRGTQNYSVSGDKISSNPRSWLPQVRSMGSRKLDTNKQPTWRMMLWSMCGWLPNTPPLSDPGLTALPLSKMQAVLSVVRGLILGHGLIGAVTFSA